MTFTELMALDKKLDKSKPVADQSPANSTTPEKNTVHPVRTHRPERSPGSRRSLSNKLFVQNDYQHTPASLPSRQPKNKVTKRHHRKRPKTEVQATERKSVRNSVRKSERSEQRPVVSTLPLRRGTKRYSFEFYVDQLEKLRRIKTEEGLKGRNLNLSEIVRSALDEYLEKIGL